MNTYQVTTEWSDRQGSFELKTEINAATKASALAQARRKNQSDATLGLGKWKIVGARQVAHRRSAPTYPTSHFREERAARRSAKRCSGCGQ